MTGLQVPRAIRTLTLVVAVILAAITLPLYAYKISIKTDYSDFDVYYRTARRLKAGDFSRIYDFTTDGKSPYRYAPPTLPLMRPLAELPFEQARLLWFFLQYLAFGLGFVLLYRTLRQVHRQALWITAASFLFVLRFCLDSFTIGQVSSLMFFGFCLSLHAFLRRRPFRAATALFIPTLFKISPAFLYGFFCTGRRRFILRYLGAFLALALSSVVLSSLWLGSIGTSFELWANWKEVIINESYYFDASHYGSQSIKSALLRLANAGWVSTGAAEGLVITSAFLGISAIAMLWLLRKPKDGVGRGLFFSLGIFAYLWFMPETFKFSLTLVAIPVAFLLCTRMKSFEWTAFAFGAVTLSLSGMDIIGERLFFASQKASVPLIAMLFLGLAVLRQALRHSKPAFVIAEIRRMKSSLGPWRKLPVMDPDLRVSVLIPLPLQASACVNPEILEKTLHSLRALLEKDSPASYEVLIVPYGERVSLLHATYQQARALTLDFPEFKLLPAPEATHGTGIGNGAALREGFLASRGKLLLGVNLEAPCGMEFYQTALSHLRSDAELVRANRRMAQSQFRIPVSVLPFVYRRHKLGLRFNQLIRHFLPIIKTSDTNSGCFGLTRSLAMKVFANQIFPYLMFDLEMALTAAVSRAREIDLPVTLYLEEEKSPHRLLGEIFSLLWGLPTLVRRYRQGCYDDIRKPEGITADDWGLSPAVNEGILELAQAQMIRRISLMGNSDYLEHRLSDLKQTGGLELGLHFNLSHGVPVQSLTTSHLIRAATGTYYSPAQFLFLWLTAFGPKKRELVLEVRATLEAQLKRVTDAGVKIVYLDGHHHIHLVPGLITAVADILRAHGIRRVRLPYDSALWITPKFPLLVLSLLARRKLDREGFEYVPCFYPLRDHFMDQGLLRAKLAQYSKQGVKTEIIVHPANANDLATVRFGDTYTEGRILEYQALRMLGLQFDP